MAGRAKKLMAEIEEAERKDGTAKVAKDAKGTRKEETKEEEERKREEAEAAKRDELHRALAAHAQESEKVWGHFKKREYDEAEKLIAELSKRPEPKLAGAQAKADAEAAALIKELWFFRDSCGYVQ